MKAFKKIVFTFITSTFCFSINAQQNNTADSIKTDSSEQATEIYIIQQKEQQKVDSIIAIRLQNELLLTKGDLKKAKEVQDKLNELSVRDSIRKAMQLQRINSLKQTATGYPVTLLDDTLFSIYVHIGPFSAKDRATAISERITKLYDDAFFNSDSLKVIQNEISYDITYNDNTIMSVTDLDALWFNKTPAELSGEYLNKIRLVIADEKEKNSVVNWLKHIGYICLILLGIWIIIYGINKLFNYTGRVLKNRRKSYFKSLSFNNVNILTPTQYYAFARRVNNLLRLVIMILAFYLALPLLFSVFPQTKPVADTLLNWIISPAKEILNGIIGFLPNLFTISIIYIATKYLLKLVKYFAIEIDKKSITIKGFYSDWAWPTFSIARFFIYAFMFVIIFPYLPGSSSPAFQGVTVFLGLIVSLGSSSAIANIVAGLVITYMRPYRIGDRVKIGEITGDVIEKTILVTRIRTIKNEDVTVPNSSILNNHTINYSVNTTDTGLILHTTVTIGYDVPWKDMHQALIDAALRTELILKEPLPFVLQTSLDDFFVSYQINAYTKEANAQATIYSDLHKNIQDVCNERGIEIMSSHYTSVRDGNTTTIPQDYHSSDYKSPSFSVNLRDADTNKKT
jgi:small-conductance mechanosensitive channel